MVVDASVILMAFFPDEVGQAQAQALTLAETRNSQLITGDRRLYNSVSRQLPWVIWIGDYHFP